MAGTTPESPPGTTSGSWTHVENVVAAAKQSVDQALADAGLTPDEPVKPKRHLHLIQGGRRD